MTSSSSRAIAGFIGFISTAKENEMSKQALINQYLMAIQAASDKALSDLVDAAMAEGAAAVPPGQGTGISQADLDAAVEKAKADMQINLDAMKLSLAKDDALLGQHKVFEASLMKKFNDLKALVDSESPQPPQDEEPSPVPSAPAPVDPAPQAPADSVPSAPVPDAPAADPQPSQDPAPAPSEG